MGTMVVFAIASIFDTAKQWSICFYFIKRQLHIQLSFFCIRHSSVGISKVKENDYKQENWSIVLMWICGCNASSLIFRNRVSAGCFRHSTTCNHIKNFHSSSSFRNGRSVFLRDLFDALLFVLLGATFSIEYYEAIYPTKFDVIRGGIYLNI